jgi:hypothetical protein
MEQGNLTSSVQKLFGNLRAFSVFQLEFAVSYTVGVLNRGLVSCPDTGPTLLQRPEGQDPLLESAPPLHDPVSSALGRAASQHSGPAPAESHCQQSQHVIL